MKYSRLHETISKTAFNWKRDSVYGARNYFLTDLWQIDSIVVFNLDSTRLYTTLNISSDKWFNSRSDQINEVIGAKVDNEWMFKLGNTYNIERRKRNQIYIPYSLEELHQISREKIFSKIISFQKNKFKVKNEFFENPLFGYSINNSIKQQKEIDSLFKISCVTFRSKKIEESEIQSAIKAIEESWKDSK